MDRHENIDYVEFAAKDLEATKIFFGRVFGWTFTDYGPEYTAFTDAGLNGGFFRANLQSSQASGGALIIFYSSNLEATLDKVAKAGGTIVKPIFTFPGGRRFQFTEPSGNEFAVWSDQGIE